MPPPHFCLKVVYKKGGGRRIFGSIWCTSLRFTIYFVLQYAVLSPCRLNLPGCLPDAYVPMKDPQPSGGKGFIGALFGGAPSEMNREEICKSNLLSKLSSSCDHHQ